MAFAAGLSILDRETLADFVEPPVERVEGPSHFPAKESHV
jgi:hypothetical protein